MDVISGWTGENCPQSKPFLTFPQHLLGRLFLLAAIGAAEGVLVGILIVGPAFHSHLVLISAVAFGVFLTLGYSWLKTQREDIPFGFKLFASYIFLLAIGIFCRILSDRSGIGVLSSYATVIAASPLLLLRFPLVILACIPLRVWGRMLSATGFLWLYSALAGVAAWALGFPIRALYSTPTSVSSHFLQILTIRALELILHFLLPGLIVDVPNYTIGSANFSVYIRPGCSGIEGLGMVLAFTSIWLWYFRKECRFPQALLLVPTAMVCIWVLNIVRLSLLIVVGDAGSPEIAMAGVHSHVGWIAFVLVALGFFMATQRLSWVRRESAPILCAAGGSGMGGLTTGTDASAHESHYPRESPAIRAYLLPFLGIMAASFVSKSASGYFEWLYPLRFVVAVVVLWYFRQELKKLNWRIGLIGPLAGVAVFVMWIAPSWLMHHQAASPLGPALAALSPVARWSWLAFRVAAAVITVPIAEELAFRGYLARRFVSVEFDQISFTSLTVLPVLFSSVVFGMMHMQNLKDWPHLMLGTLAGLAFAAALRWKGRIGDAVAAHAVTNLLLAAWVLGFGDWAQW